MEDQQSFGRPYLEESETWGRWGDDLEEAFKAASHGFCWIVEVESELFEKCDAAKAFARVVTGPQEAYERLKPFFAP